MSAHDFDMALSSLERDSSLLDLIEKLNTLDNKRAAQIQALHAELAELRDGMVALSNRLESVSRATFHNAEGRGYIRPAKR